MLDLDIAIWTHVHTELIEKCAASVARHVKGSYNLVMVCEPGSCHENMQRVLDRSRSRFLLFLDHDVELLDDDTVPRLIHWLKEGYGAVCPREILDFRQISEYKRLRGTFGSPKLVEANLDERPWLPAYSLMVDRAKCPGLAADTSIPWIKGMTDVDLSYQIIAAGYKLARDNAVAVKHEDHRARSVEDRTRIGSPTVDDQRAHFPEQMRYMQEKWGKTPH